MIKSTFRANLLNRVQEMGRKGHIHQHQLQYYIILWIRSSSETSKRTCTTKSQQYWIKFEFYVWNWEKWEKMKIKKWHESNWFQWRRAINKKMPFSHWGDAALELFSFTHQFKCGFIIWVLVFERKEITCDDWYYIEMLRAPCQMQMFS